MRRALLLLVVAAVAAVGVDVLGDLTQSRPDSVAIGSRSEVVIEVSTRDRDRPAQRAAEGLWGACQGTVRHRLAAPGLVDVGGGRFRLVTEPALGEHSWRRLQGCLEDATLERVKARVVAKRDLPPAP